jgi:hypothetical protein
MSRSVTIPTRSFPCATGIWRILFVFILSLLFPNVSIRNPGGDRNWPPIKTFAGDAFGINFHRYLLMQLACCRTSHSLSRWRYEMTGYRCSVAMYSAITFTLRSAVSSLYFAFSASLRKISPQTGISRSPCPRTARLPSMADMTLDMG